MNAVIHEQLSLEPQKPEKKPPPLPFLCACCVVRDPATDPPCELCGVDVVDGVGIPY